MTNPFELNRFVLAQAETFEAAFAEIQQGQKRTHWMWYIFPQLSGLGRSQMAQKYSIISIDEARAYLAHPILGSRLRACVDALLKIPNKTAVDVFGRVDAMKLHSSLTLFCEADGEAVFSEALDRWFGGVSDLATLELLKAQLSADLQGGA